MIFKKIWDDFRLGQLSMNQADDLITVLCKEKEQKKEDPKHIPGRYDGEPFWTIHYGNRCEPLSHDTHYTDHKAPRITGSCCKTKEEAEFIIRQQKAYLQLIDSIHELNDGWTPDWKKDDESKHTFYYGHLSETINLEDAYCSRQYFKDELYFEEEKIGRELIKELGADLIKLALWGIE